MFQQIFLLEETKLYYNGKEFEAKVIKKRLILSNQSVEGSISLEIFPSHLAFTYSTSMLTVLENYACITKCGVLFFKRLHFNSKEFETKVQPIKKQGKAIIQN